MKRVPPKHDHRYIRATPMKVTLLRHGSSQTVFKFSSDPNSEPNKCNGNG